MSTKTSVLLFVRDFEKPKGGVANYYSVVLGKLGKDIDIETFHVGRRPGLLEPKVLYPIQFILDCLRLVFVACRRNHDVYHFNPSLNKASFFRDAILIFILSFFQNRNILIFFRGWDDAFFEKLISRRWSRSIYLWILARASRILVLASTIRQSLVDIGVPHEKIEITSTTFDGSLLKSEAGHRQSDAFTFLFMSRLEEAKGIFELLDAVKVLKARGYDFRLIVAGAGSSEGAIRDKLEQDKLEELVVMPGYLRAGDKAEALMSADVFVLPTYHGEGCPNCLLEAMGAGLPIITTNVGGIPDIVEANENGIILDGVTPAEIARAMQSFMDDEELRATVSEANKNRAWKRYESENVAKYLESVYCQIATQA